MNTVSLEKIQLTGQTGKLLDNIIDRWLLGICKTNPAILEMFADRDLKPYRDLLPWSGEFAGKYITGAYYVYLLTRRQDLYEEITKFIDQLMTYQAEDGYLGCFSKECRMTGAFSQNPKETGLTWDSWNHYHIMFGLLLWYDLTGNPAYLDCVERIANFYLTHFYQGKPRLVSIGSSEMNLAVYHLFALLYEKTEKEAYLEFAKEVETDLSDETAGNYIHYSQQGYEFYQCPKPRWESLHVIMGFTQMYRNTGKPLYLQVASQIFYSILSTDVHNTGGFSTNEQAVGNPYQNGVIETCCVIAYNALGIELFSLTGDLKILDFLERSHYNAVLGYYSPTGRWSTYHTPMDGSKCANFHSINFQCRPGSPELNCCSVNAPRGLANIASWMVTKQEGCTYLNFYEDLCLETDDGIFFEVSGNYPANNHLRIKVESKGQKRGIAFRIPGWSKETCVKIGNEIFRPTAGTYLFVTRIWADLVEITFDFTPYFQAGDDDCKGKSSIYLGPVLYGFDLHDHPTLDFNNLPPLSKKELFTLSPKQLEDGSICLTFSDGVTLKDFYHLGVSGSEYKTWLPLE